jgi:hypothetical protein
VIDDSRYLVIGLEKFHQDLHILRQQAKANPAVYRELYRSVLREIERLRTAATDGHHALGYEAGKGDLRDCVVGYVQSDPEQKPDYRLVFREIRVEKPGELPRRELLAIKPRHGSNNIYAHVCARLNRHPADRQPGLDRFGDRPADSGGSQASRQAELDTKRAIAHAWTGQQPLVSSRPLTLIGPPRSHALASGNPRAGPRTSPGPPRPINARSGPTGWPTRRTQSLA